MWSKLMQHAEGPIAFEDGYRRMMSKYDNDEPRKTYIQQLHDDPNKAHFKKVYVFSNGTLVDVCESLFSATKTWTCGSGRISTSLFMAVVRIVSGCRDLVIKNFLFRPADTVRLTANKTSCIPVKQMFKYLSVRLTRSAVRTMYTMVDRDSRKYEIDIVSDSKDTIVTRKHGGDRFVVKDDFRCFGASSQCWQQLHKGMLCPHAVQAAVERMSLCTSEKDRDVVCKKMVRACHPNWYRSTYERTEEVFVPPPPPVKFERKGIQPSKEQSMIKRFRHVTPYLDPSVIEKYLYKLEKLAFSGNEYKKRSENEERDVTAQVPLLKFSNPQLRRKRKHEQM